MRLIILSTAVHLLVLLSEFCVAQQSPVQTLQAEVIKMEASFADAVKAQDSAKASQLQSESFFLAIGVQQMPIQIVTKSQWLSTLKYYVTESYKIDDIKVNIYGNTAVVLMLFTQKATVRGQDRSAQFYITDIWNKTDSGWKISERHSSRPEQPSATRPK
jgi:ketosteroid isomerase-like protein